MADQQQSINLLTENNPQISNEGNPEPENTGTAHHDDDEGSVSSGDSAFWDIQSSTMSVSSSVYNYEIAHGRTYHANQRGQYYQPNDADEIERMDITYHAARLALDEKHFYAPIENPQQILDIGTGSGAWCIDVADDLPNCIVKGIDLSPMQPSYVPPNCSFEIANADDEWTFGVKFDLIHTRLMHDYSLKSWPNFFRQSLEHLRPGGWVEMQEFDPHPHSDDNSIPQDWGWKIWSEEWSRGISKVGMVGYCEPEVVMNQMQEAGFVNVKCRMFKLPIGPWPKDPKLKESGTFCLCQLSAGLYGLSVKCFTELLEYTAEELEVFLMKVRKDLRRRKVHAYWPLFVILGQKPEV